MRFFYHRVAIKDHTPDNIFIVREIKAEVSTIGISFNVSGWFIYL